MNGMNGYKACSCLVLPFVSLFCRDLVVGNACSYFASPVMRTPNGLPCGQMFSEKLKKAGTDRVGPIEWGHTTFRHKSPRVGWIFNPTSCS